MKHRKTISLTLCFVLTFVSAIERDQKHFSLFSIVTFKNEQCSAVSTAGLIGTCTTTEECTGTVDGNCASGFGVCCVYTVSACSSSVTKNCTYIENPSYPTTYATAGTCAYTVTRTQDDICQIRLDFFDTVLMQPTATAGAGDVCTNTILQVVSGTTSQSRPLLPPQVCGTLTGQHMYLDSGRAATAATLTFTFIAASTANQWRIKVSQIECGNPNRAPPGCLQYFYGGQRNTWTSFNWDGTKACATGCILSTQMYSVCFRPEKGMCGNSFVQTAVASTLDSWDLPEMQDDTGAELGLGEQTALGCLGGAIHIQTEFSATQEMFCGSGFLDIKDASGAPGVVYAAESQPWVVDVNIIANIEAASAGWSVDSIQTPCT